MICEIKKELFYAIKMQFSALKKGGSRISFAYLHICSHDAWRYEIYIPLGFIRSDDVDDRPALLLMPRNVEKGVKKLLAMMFSEISCSFMAEKCLFDGCTCGMHR